MQTTFRFPGSADYSYAELVTSPGSVGDNRREIGDLDAQFMSAVGNALTLGCSLVAMGALQPHVIEETQEPTWNNPATVPEWAAQPPQEAQTYSTPPQQYNQPQNGYQAPQGGYQQQPQYQGYQTQPQNAHQAPPGRTAPNCQRHGMSANLKPGGVSKRTNKPYDAFWVCAANDQDCTKASSFPKP